MTNVPRILVVDDEPSMREMICVLLKRHDYQVTDVSSGDQAVALFESGETFNLVVTDLLMDRGSGIDVLEAAKIHDSSCEVILITAFGTAETAVEAMKKGAFDYIAKPFNVDEFMIIVQQSLERQRLIRENINLRARVRGEYRLADVVGRSRAMLDVMSLCLKVADSTATVLVSGESGTGKEVVARAIHFSGNRSSEPFVAINCGALPEQLMESELFGHVKGAFTGALDDKEGLFRAANKGTVFLDEIGELPPPLQVKMLRVLQDRMVRPVGGASEIPVNIRVMAATNQDLEERVRNGRFRTDLYYRLNVIHINLPPLAERKEDIPLLVEHLMARLAGSQGTEPRQVSQDAMRILLRYDFPGNVRELANILERAATLASSDCVEIEDLPRDLTRPSIIPTSRLLTLPEDGMDLDAALEEVERNLIGQALTRTNGVRTQAAALLGISFRSFRYRLNKLNWDPDGEQE